MEIFTESMKAPLSFSLFTTTVMGKKIVYIYPTESLQRTCTIFKIWMLTKNPLNYSFSLQPAHWSRSGLIMWNTVAAHDEHETENLQQILRRVQQNADWFYDSLLEWPSYIVHSAPVIEMKDLHRIQGITLHPDFVVLGWDRAPLLLGAKLK